MAKVAVKDKKHMDWWLLGLTLILAGFGLVMVLSASAVMAERYFDDKYLFFRKQALFAGVGVLAMAVMYAVPKKLIYGLIYLWLLIAAGLLAMTFTPLGVNAGGASRWIALGPVSIQPMEFTKVALALYLAYFFGKKQEMVKTFSVGFIPPFLVTGLFCLLLLFQPDFGGAVILCSILFFLSLVGGTRLSYLFGSVAVAILPIVLLVVNSPYRFRRWTAFLDPFKSAREEGYQLVQSLYAFGSGQITGEGLGAGKQKLFFLPEAHNDFIMAVVGEELGFVGVSVIFLLLAFFLVRAFRVAWQQQDLQDRFTAFGMCLILSLGFMLNLAVVMGTVPPKGVPMPFISYGGSSLVASFLCVGMLLNLSREVSR